MNVVIVPAAGSGKRMNVGAAKAFLPLAGIPILVHTLRAMDRTPLVDAVVVVAPAALRISTRRLIKTYGIEKVVRVVAGGSERQDSVFAGLKAARSWLSHQSCFQGGEPSRRGSSVTQDSALSSQDSSLSTQDSMNVILVHDAARALIEPRDFARVIRAARRSGAAILAIEPRDTLKQISGNRIVATLDRRAIRQAQTPQGFHFDLLYRAHLEARRRGILATDEAALVEQLGVEVSIVKGSESNVKITHPQDLVVAEALLSKRKSRLRIRRN